jgi:hypothetical protein
MGVRLLMDLDTQLVRGTDMIQAARNAGQERRITNWLNPQNICGEVLSGGTLDLFRALATKRGVPIESLYEIVRGGSRQGSWISFEVVPALAAWCDPAFSLEVADVYTRYLRGQITTDDSQGALRDMIASAHHMSAPPPSVAAAPNTGQAPSLPPAHHVGASTTARRAHLVKSTTNFPPTHISTEIRESDGVYINLLGAELCGASSSLKDVIKFGESDHIDTRNSRDHMRSAKHSQMLWASTPTVPRCTSRKMEKALLRIAAKVARDNPDWAEVVPNTNNEEYRVSPQHTVAFIREVICLFNERFHNEVACSKIGGEIYAGDGAHAATVADKDASDAAYDAALEADEARRDEAYLTRHEETKRLMAKEDTLRIQEETKREIARESTKQSVLEATLAMVNNGYSVEDIERVCRAST